MSGAPWPVSSAPDAARALGFLFDANRCTGCAACVLACSTESDLGWGTSWRQIVPFNPERRSGVPSFHLSLACNHCADAPCVTHCPTGAMRRDPSTGAVLVAEDACIGCRYCAWVCPYDAPRFDGDRGVMTKCTSCNHRLLAGDEPACVEACPTAALGWGSEDGEHSASLIPGFPEASVGARIAFAPLRRMTPPESTWSVPEDVAAAFTGQGGSGAVALPGAGGEAPPPPRGRPLAPVVLSLRGELPLLFFTSGMAALAGWIGAAALGPVPVSLPVFLGVAAVLMAASTLHLGRPAGAWRALTNVRTSALSREIAWVSAFLGVATLWLAWGGAGGAASLPLAPEGWPVEVLGVVAGAVGWVALAAMDLVYRPVRRRRAVHSADTIFTGPLVVGALLRSPAIFGVFAVLKLVLWARRRHRPTIGTGLPSAVRMSGLIGPLVLWALLPHAWPGWALLLVAAGELVDRAVFYSELAIPGPRAKARDEAAAWRR